MLHQLRKIAFISIVFTISTVLRAQEHCKCSEAEQTTVDAKLLQKLISSPSAFCKAKGYELRGKELLQRRELDSAFSFLETALKYYKQTGCKENSYVSVYKYLTNLYQNKADYETALNYNLKILAIAEQEKNDADIATGLLNVSQVFMRLKQYEKSQAYTRNAITVVTKLPASERKADLLNRIAARYIFYFENLHNILYNDTAAFYAKQGLELAKEINYVQEQIHAYARLNSIAQAQKNNAQALEYINEALKLCVPGKHNSQLASLYLDKAAIHKSKENYTEAGVYADSALHYCKFDKFPPMIANAYSLIYEIETKRGNHKEALLAYTREREITDSVNTQDRSKAVNELEKKYNQAKNEKTISELSLQKQIYLLLAVVALLGIGAIGFFLRQQSLKHKQKILETEQRLNRSRMNPHFFFNALASLQSFALEKNDGRAIAGNLSKFSGLMRETLESTYNDYVTIEQETDFLKQYLDLQLLRFPEKFIYTIEADDELEQDELLVPSMIVQPFVENSIEHGFSGIDYKGIINVHFSKKEKELHIAITDNGKGFSKEKNNSSNHISRAGQIVKDRIYLLNLKLKSKAGFSIEEGKDNGVVVKIVLPAMYKS
jgi:tetratricopeptide (TPR) repeat protein